MKAMSASDFRKSLAKAMDRVNSDHEPLLVTRTGGSNAVLISEEDWAGIEETLYLLESPRNAERLLDAIAQADRGEGVERTLIDPDEESESAA